MAGKEKNEKKYKTEALLKSKRFSHIQRDFLQAILWKESYTIPEAQKAVREFFKEKESDS